MLFFTRSCKQLIEENFPNEYVSGYIYPTFCGIQLFQGHLIVNMNLFGYETVIKMCDHSSSLFGYICLP